jgi:hypothetical protein
MATRERDLRVMLLNTLLTTPHRNLDALFPVHQELIRQDPIFYVQLAAWYAAEGEVRDHKEMFVINLVLSDFRGHREVGLALLRMLPPYQVGRVVDTIKGRTRRRKVVRDGQEEATVEKTGLFRNVPRSMRTEIARYLREREESPEWFDSSVLQARATLKRLYASLRIKPSKRAQAILFDEDPPPDSRLFALKLMRQARTPAEQARAIVKHRIPYRVAVSVIKGMTPSVLVALIDQMSPQELINSLKSLRQHGAFDSPEVKELIESRLEAAQTAERVSAYKAKVAAEAAGVSQDVVEKLDAVTEAQVKARGVIKRPTALLVDKSGSMEEAIEVGKQLAAMIAGICEAELYVYAFDTMAYPIGAGRPGMPGFLGKLFPGLQKQEPAEEGETASLAQWEKAFAGIQAVGNTSCGVAVEMMRRKGQAVEQIVMVTDEGENTHPRFVEALLQYRQELGVDPQVILVKVASRHFGMYNVLERDCQQARVAYDAYEFRGDYYALPNLLPLLTRPSRLELLMEIMAYPLPERKPA